MFTAVCLKARYWLAIALLIALSAQNIAFADPTLSYVTNADQSATHVVQPSDMTRIRHIDLPEYTNDLIRSGVQGTIEVQAHVGADGRVIDAVIANTESNALSRAEKNVLASVRSATFYPTIENGKAIETLIVIPFRFELVDRTVSTFPFKRVAKSRLARAN